MKKNLIEKLVFFVIAGELCRTKYFFGWGMANAAVLKKKKQY